MASAIRRFPIDKESLEAGDKRAFDKLVQAVELLPALYLKQKNPKYPGANLYPPDASREEIESAGKKNPALLDPYTIVERSRAGDLVAVPYREKFTKELTEIAKLLKEAAAFTSDKTLKAYLVSRAKDLLGNNLDESNALWLQTANAKIGFVIGPFDRFLDRHFHKKRAYSAWLGILNEEQTSHMRNFAKAMLTSERRYLPGAKLAKAAEVRVRVEETALMAGLDADFEFVSNNLPSSADTKLIKKSGTMSTVFLPVVRWKFSSYIKPVYESVFAETLEAGYSDQEIELGLLRMSVLDELRRSLARYDDAVSRLSEVFAYMDEVYGDISTIKSAAYLYLKGVLQERELEAILVAEVCQALAYVGTSAKKSEYASLAKGYIALLDFLLNGGALQKTAKGFSFDMKRALIAVDHLEGVFDNYVALGTREETKAFFEGLDTGEVLEKFAPAFQSFPQEKKD